VREKFPCITSRIYLRVEAVVNIQHNRLRGRLCRGLGLHDEGNARHSAVPFLPMCAGTFHSPCSILKFCMVTVKILLGLVAEKSTAPEKGFCFVVVGCHCCQRLMCM